MGRPTKCTPEVRDAVVDALKSGVSIESAAHYAGICEKSIFNWLELGKNARTGPHRDFFAAVRRAQASVEIRAAAVIAKAAPGDWRAAAFLLERRFPAKWGNRRQNEQQERSAEEFARDVIETIAMMRASVPRPPLASGAV